MRLLALLVMVCFSTSMTSAAYAADLKDDLKPEQLYKKVLPSVMTLTVQKADGTTATGTGFLAVKEGLAVTAWHVVKDATRATAKFSDGEQFEVSGLVDNDDKRDVALIRVKEFGRPLLPLATAAPEVGTKAYAVGAPEGLEFSLSDGLVSQTQKDGGVTLYQFSCPVSPGNSGGPLVNAGGEVIGVVSRQMRDGQNLNFAMPAAYALALDATLPTQVWNTVKPNVPSPAAPANTIIDALFAKVLFTLADAATAVRVMDETVVQKSGGYMDGCPTRAYVVQRALTSEAAELGQTSSSDPMRERVRVLLGERIKVSGEALDLEMRAIRAAQVEGGWYGQSSDLLAQSAASFQEATADYSDEIKKIDSSHDCLVADFETGASGNQAIGSEYDFLLGAYTWVDSPLELAVVPRSGLAYRLGFRTGDTLVSVGAGTPKCLEMLKLEIKDNSGRKVRAVVIRDGKRKEWETNIPRELIGK